MMEIPLIEYLKKINGNILVTSWGGGAPEIPFQVQPKQFLQFAEYDLNSEYEHHLINSLSNIKRAIDCQMDSLLFSFGLLEKSRRDRWTFPMKMDYLNKIGIVSPRILNKINQKRNLLEHEYIKPIKEDIEDALDIATLFIAYTERYIRVAGYIRNCEVVVDINKDMKAQDIFNLTLEYENNKILFKFRFYNNKHVNKLIEINSNSEDYIECLKWIVNLCRTQF